MPDYLKLLTKTDTESTYTDADTYGDISRVNVSEGTAGTSTEGTISPLELYPLHGEHLLLSSAFQLLREGTDYLTDAIRMFDDDDRLGADDALQHFQALLPELFSCRGLGDGFGAIINSVFHSLKNLDGLPLNGQQLQTVRKVIRRISTEPYISFEEALQEIELLRDVGLEVQPRYFKFAADLLSE